MVRQYFVDECSLLCPCNAYMGVKHCNQCVCMSICVSVCDV